MSNVDHYATYPQHHTQAHQLFPLIAASRYHIPTPMHVSASATNLKTFQKCVARSLATSKVDLQKKKCCVGNAGMTGILPQMRAEKCDAMQCTMQKASIKKTLPCARPKQAPDMTSQPKKTSVSALDRHFEKNRTQDALATRERVGGPKKRQVHTIKGTKINTAK